MSLLKFSKNHVFNGLLEAQADCAHRAALEYQALAADYGRLAEHVATIKKIESEADNVTHQLANKLDATFVTPLDKEDIRALSSELDNITDFIEAGTGRLALYQLPAPRPDLAPLLTMLVNVTELTVTAVKSLRDIRGREAIQDLFIRIHQIENDHDTAYRQALATLLNAPDADPIMVIKWREIYDRLEIAVDKCEDVANIIESVVVKYA